MAGGDNGSSSRASSGYLSEEESPDYGLIFKYFKENKVEIASAITKPFPFLMSLRDRGYISERKFRNYRQSCENQIPPEIVYDILSDLQNKFSLRLMKVLFSPTHLKAYPDLKKTLRNFTDVSNNHRTPQRMSGRDADERPRLPALVAEETFFTNESRRQIRSPEASCSPGSSQMNDEQKGEVPRFLQCIGEGSSSCEQMFDGQEPQDDRPSSAPRPEAGAERSTSENEMCSCVMCPSAKDPEASMGNSQSGKKKGHNLSRVKQRRPQTVRPKNGTRVGHQAVRRKKTEKNPGRSAKTRVLKRCRNKNSRFSAELLPVTCGKVKGTLHKDKFKQGIFVKSIQSEAGDWYTPIGFENLGGLGRSKNWKLSVHCYKWPLKFLIQKKFLPNSPRTYGKRKKRTQDLSSASANAPISFLRMVKKMISDECEVCQNVGLLFCCDTCPRAFHEECHIPAVEAEKTPWSCISCRIQSLGRQQSHPESEVLQRRMAPQEQLCRETSVGIMEPMWLDLIKKKLKGRDYFHVKEFVQDMRLIFQNHGTTFKDHNFGQMGLRLESEFEKNFKEVFAIQDTNGNS